MALPKVEEARQLDDEALEEQIVVTKRRLFELRFQKATRQLESGLHQFKHERHRLAQLMTVRRERLLAAEPVAVQPQQAPPVASAEEEE
ncbi:MAG: 50S ribosomal protein L29 [Leptolyngbya sp. SIO1D8]|nr:50S ribosomal protein L29 [Leptolyngbya sp. SIO1D8]